MKLSNRWLVAALLFSSFSSSALAAPKSTWDGIWSGAWGGSRPTSVTIANEQVVSYEYGGASTPVSASTVTASLITYGDKGTVVTIRKTGKTTASGDHT